MTRIRSSLHSGRNSPSTNGSSNNNISARPRRSMLLWLMVFAVVLLVRTIDFRPALWRKQFRRWRVRGSRRLIRKLRKKMDRIIAKRNKIDICFVTSIFGEELENTDKPGDVSSVWLDEDYSRKISTTFRFFIFTNLQDMPISEGWTKIVKTDEELPYRRFITKSRWPKFMGWKDKHLQPCATIFYFDGHYQVVPANMYDFPTVAREIKNTPTGLAQRPHPKGGTALSEFSRILLKHKDIPSNVEASVLWLQSQPDFDNRCKMYQNTFFGYDPKNPTWQAAVEFFWNRYSLEVDSWRDQPLWCYTLQHVGLTQPMMLPEEGSNGLFQKDKSRTGHNDHQYNEEADGKKSSESLSSPSS
jgi:hypothetical protein